ncbi:thermonuclease family protein [Pantanalinema rosaneae CENA516]|uniref:thermonuclease family protein n=1 Tax=Pantanalinema rosaneae TaxID=1620701 RepID=UPI003D7011FD
MHHVPCRSSHWQQVIGRSFIGFLVTLLVLLIHPPAIAATNLTLPVWQVISGRELEVGGISGYPEITERVRLVGIDTPEVDQAPWGEMAKQHLEQWVGNRPIVLESDAASRDDQGRRLAYVWSNGKLLNEQLVAEGYALAVPQPPNSKYDQRLAHAQEQARLLGLGIWNPKHPMRLSPAEFRQRSGR